MVAPISFPAAVDVVVGGAFTVVGEFNFPLESIKNADVSTTAGIEASKLEHQHPISKDQIGTAEDATIPLHIVLGATCTVVEVAVSNVVACTGNATVTIDIQKNGTTILSSVITLDSTLPAANGNKRGTISVAGGVVDDNYTIVVNATIGSGALATGLNITVVFDEDYVS